MHGQLCEKAINQLKKLNETSKLVLYGSVARGNYRPNSDIDIAFICHEEFRLMILDDEGLPFGLRQKIDDVLNKIKNPNHVSFHVPIYWESEFEKGIKLTTDERSSRHPEMLHKVGIVRYDACIASSL